MKGNKKLISVLIPTYNRVKYLEECLNSVVKQQWFKRDEIEILIWDNSEWNETKEFMNEFLKLNHKYNIRYVKNKKNMWWTWNINNLLDLSRWVYYIILSDDDKFYDENSLKITYNWLLNYGLDACYWRQKTVDENWQNLQDYIPHKKIKDKEIYFDSFDEQILNHTIAFSWVLYKQFWYRYDTKSKRLWDWHMNLQYLYNWKKIWLINKYTYLYRVHNSNDWLTMPKLFIRKFAYYSFKYFNVPYTKRVYYFSKIFINGIIWRIKWIFEKIFKCSWYIPYNRN